MFALHIVYVDKLVKIILLQLNSNRYLRNVKFYDMIIKVDNIVSFTLKF